MTHLYVGTAYNQILSVPFHPQSPIQPIGQKKKQKIVSISESYNHMYFCSHKNVYSYNKVENELETIDYCPQNEKIIACFAPSEDSLVECFSSGSIVELIQSDEENQEKWKKLILHSSTAKQYEKAINTKKQICLMGKGVLPFIYDINNSVCCWKAKNVSNDQLDLQVPIFDVDGVFLNSDNHLALAHAFNSVRLYDVRGQRRKPILNTALNIEKVKLTTIEKSVCENYLYVGNECGSIYELDVRKNLVVGKKYKGINTCITDLLVTENSIISCSLDAYINVYDRNSRQLKLKKYLNIHPSVIHLLHEEKEELEKELYKLEEVDLEEQEEEKVKVKKVKQIRKRNKVGLKYLEVKQKVKFEEKEEQDDIQ